ncbi:MAG: hypothetical protein ACLRQ0_01485 [Monoglobales bacterium]
MQERAITDLANKWIEEEINVPYFKSIKNKVKTAVNIESLSDEMMLFLAYGMDLDDKLLSEVEQKYKMTKEDLHTALIVRLKAALRDAKQYAESHDNCDKINKLIDDLQNKGLDGRSCELWIAEVRSSIS